jgi:hypothetical protein
MAGMEEYGLSAADVQTGGTSDYVEGLRAALGLHEAAFTAMRQGVVAGGNLATGHAAELNMASVEAAQ